MRSSSAPTMVRGLSPAPAPPRTPAQPSPLRPADRPSRPLSAVARDLPKLRANGITHVLNAAGVACPNYHEGSLEYLTLNLYDTPREDILPFLYTAVEFITGVVDGGGKCYIHCHQGVSRSSSMCIAYLMHSRKIQCATPPTRDSRARAHTAHRAPQVADGRPPSPVYLGTTRPST